MPHQRRGPRVGCISLEPWDDTWRRNQHFAAQLVRQGLVDELVFVEPPVLGRRGFSWSPEPGIRVVRPALPLPKRLGGLWLAARLLRAGALRSLDLLWVNDPQLGVQLLRRGVRSAYDVTDDWRTFDQPERIRQRIVRAEGRLARDAGTVVCSAVLAERWHDRYGTLPPVVHNAVDLETFARAVPTELPGPPPHVGYIGTLHEQRLDLELVYELADSTSGTVHLVGPDALSEEGRARLQAHPRIALHGPVPSADVPAWMTAMDVLLCPHLVSPFTLSLDAIKSYEYLAANRPVVTTPTSGFQLLEEGQGLLVVDRRDFVGAVAAAAGASVQRRPAVGWADRAGEFAAAIRATAR